MQKFRTQFNQNPLGNDLEDNICGRKEGHPNMTIFHYVSSFSLNSKKYIKWTISYAFNSDTNIIESLLSEGKLSIEVF